MVKLSCRSILSLFFVILIAANIMLADDVSDAAALLAKGSLKEALTLAQAAVEANPGNSDANFVLAKIYFKLGKLTEAKDYINKSIDMDKGNQTYRDFFNEMNAFNSKRNEANRYISDNNWAEAKKVLESMIQENPNYVDGYSLLGQVSQRMSDVKAASIYYKKAADLEPENEKHMQSFDALVNQALYEGTNMMKRKNYGEALTFFQQAIDISDNDYRGYYYSGYVQYIEKQYDEALKNTEKSISLNPEYEKSYLIKGKILDRQNKPDEAIAAFNDALKVNAKYADALSNIGLIEFNRSNWDAAISAYQKVIAIEPKNDKALDNLGASYMEKKDYQNAVSYLNRAVAIDAKDHNTWTRLATSNNKLDKPEDAKVAAQSALKVRQNYAPALIELGIAERRMGNKQAAKEAFTLASRDPKWKKVAEFELKTVQ